MFDKNIYEVDPRKLEKLIDEVLGLKHEIHHLVIAFKELRDILRHRAKSATLTITSNHPRRKHMPATINVGGTATAAYREFDGPNGTGNEVPAAQAPTFSSSDESVATVDANGLVTGVAAGSATITGSDAANGLSASDSLTVQATQPTAQSATLTLTAN